MNDIIDLHTHTIASGHAYNTLYEMVQAASRKGVQLIGSSDHAPAMPGACDSFYFINFKAIPRKLFGIHLLMGCELNILDHQGNVDLKPYFLKRMDYAIASIHDVCYEKGTVSQNTDAYLGVMNNPHVTIIGHPDDGRFPYDHDTLAAAAREHHKLLEINSSSLHPKSPRPCADENYRKLLKACIKYQTPVIISSDAHIEADIGNHARAHELLKEMDFPESLIVNRSMEALIPYIPKLKEYLEQDKEPQNH